MARMIRKLEREPGSSRRNPGRGDGLQWRSSAYISPQNVDHDDAPEEDEGTTHAKGKDATTAEEEDEDVPRASDGAVVCLIDIAKPAKRKGESCSLVSGLFNNTELKPRTVKKHRVQAVARSESVMSFSDIGDLESVMTEDWEALSELCEEDETFSLIGEEEEEEGAEREAASGNKQYEEVVKEVDRT
ncbi:hypothetical protein EV121DRAFT_283909 [Schizophyllum commune]